MKTYAYGMPFPYRVVLDRDDTQRTARIEWTRQQIGLTNRVTFIAPRPLSFDLYTEDPIHETWCFLDEEYATLFEMAWG